MGKIISAEEAIKNLATTTTPKGAVGYGSGFETPSDFGKSKFDKNALYTDLTNLNDFRAESQPLPDRLVNGVSKALINVPVRVIDGLVSAVAFTVGGIANIADVWSGQDNIKMSDFMNNPISLALDGISKDLQEAMPVYRTDEYERGGIGEKLTSLGTFWADTMTDAASFMLSSYIGGAGVGSLLSKVGGLSRASVLSKVIAALDETAAVKGIGTVGKLTPNTKALISSVYSGVGESAIEAREIFKSVLERGGTEEEARAAMNFGFLTNMVLTAGTNFITFGKQFGGEPKERILNTALLSKNADGKLGVKELTKAQKSLKALGVLLDPVGEAGQEAGQFVTTKFLENYYTGDDETRNDFLKSMTDAVSELKSSEGIESMLAGFMLGGLATGFKTGAEKLSKEKPETDESRALAAATAYNTESSKLYGNLFNDKTKSLAGLLSRTLQNNQAGLAAQVANDEFTLGFLDQTGFSDTVTTYTQVGEFDNLITQLEAAKNTPVEEIQEIAQAEAANKLTEDEKNLLVDRSIEQAKKIKNNYESLVRQYSNYLTHEDIAKITTVDTMQEYVTETKRKLKTDLKPLLDIDATIRGNYLTPEQVNKLNIENSEILSSLKTVKSKASTEKTDKYNAEIERLSNQSNDILKRIENSLTDEERFYTITSTKKERNEKGEIVETVEEREVSRDYKSQIVTKLNKALKELEQATERNRGDLTEFKKYQKLVSDYVKVQKMQDSLIDSKNQFLKDPQGFFSKVNSNMAEIREASEAEKLFTIKGQQPIINEVKNGKNEVGYGEAADIVVKPGLYYQAKGRRSKKTEDKQLSGLYRNKREFVEIEDTFVKVDGNGVRQAWVKVKEKEGTKEYPLSYFEGKLNATTKTLDGILTDGKITEEEAFYLQYKDRVIQYQYKESKGATPIILHGMVTFNYAGNMVLRYMDKNGKIKFTSKFKVEKGKKDGDAFQVSFDHPHQATRENASQYLKVLSEKESKIFLEIQALEDLKKIFVNTANKLKRNKKGGTVVTQTEVEAKKAEYDKRDVNSLEAVMPNNPNHKKDGLGISVGDKFNQGQNIIIVNNKPDENYDGREKPYEVITKVIEPQLHDANGKMIQTAKVEVTLFNNKEEADIAIQKEYERIKSLQGKSQNKINAKLKTLEEQSTSTAQAEIEKKHTFTRESMNDISEGTAFAKKGSKVINPDKVTSQFSIGDKIEFFDERKRTGIWNGTHIVEDKTNTNWGVLGLISNTTAYIKNTTKIDAELKALEQSTSTAQTETETDTISPSEQIIVQEHNEVKSKLKEVQTKLDNLKNKTGKRGTEYTKIIASLNERLVKIEEYKKATDNLIQKYETDIKTLESLIAKAKNNKEVTPELKAKKEELLGALGERRIVAQNHLNELKAADNAFKENASTFYQILKDLRKDFSNIIDADKLYNSEFISKLVRAVPDYGMEVRFKTKEMTGQDIEEIFTFVIENNNEELLYLNEDNIEVPLKINLESLEELGNEEYAERFDTLKNIIDSIDPMAVESLVAVKTNRIGTSIDPITGSGVQFFDNALFNIEKLIDDLKFDDTIQYFKTSNIKYKGEDDVFIANSDGTISSPKKTIEQGLTTTSPNLPERYNPSWDNETKSQWIYQKVLANMGDDIDNYLIEYSIEDFEKYKRNDSFDNDPLEKAILVRIVDKEGNTIRFNSLGEVKTDGTGYEAITTLESATYKTRGTDGKHNKYREIDEISELKSEFDKPETTEDRKKEIQNRIDLLDSAVKEHFTNIQKERAKILEVLDKGERFVTRISYKSVGIAIPNIDSNTGQKRFISLPSALGEDYANKIESGKFKVAVVKPGFEINHKPYNLKQGTVVLYENTTKTEPKIYILNIKNNTKYQADYAAKLIYDFGQLSATNNNPDFKKFYNQIRAVLYWGSIQDINKDYSKREIEDATEDDVANLKEKAYHIRFKYGTNSTVLEYGNYIGVDENGKPKYDIKEVSYVNIKEDKDFLDWVQSKRTHIPASRVEDAAKMAEFFEKKYDNGLYTNVEVSMQPATNLQFISQYIKPTGERLARFKDKEVKPKAPIVKTPPTSSNPPTGSKPIQGKDIYEGVTIVAPQLMLDDNISYDEGLKIFNEKLASGEIVFTEKGKELSKIAGINIDKLDKLVESTKESAAAKHLGNEYNTVDENQNQIIELKRPTNSVQYLNAVIQRFVFNDVLTTTVTQEAPPVVEAAPAKAASNLSIVGEEFVAPVEKNTPVEPSASKKKSKLDNLIEDEDEKEVPYLTKTQVLDKQPKIRLSQLINRNDFKDYINTTVTVVKGLIDGIGFGALKQTVDDLGNISYNILVSEDAPLGTEYHEKFHLIERAVFTPAQLKGLYNTWRKATGEINLTDSEVSERLAEEFRYFSINKDLETKQLKGSIIEEVLKFIENFIKDIAHLMSYNQNNKFGAAIEDIFNDFYNNQLDGEVISEYFSTHVSETRFTKEELKAMSKSALLQYYNNLTEIKDFNYFDFFTNEEYKEEVKLAYINEFKTDENMAQEATDSVLIDQIIYDFKADNTYLKERLKDPVNKRDFIEEFKLYYNQINGEVLEIEDIDINNEEATGGKGEAGLDIEPTSVNHIVKSPAIVNQLLSTIEGDKNFLGLSEHIDINKTKVDLIKLLAEETTEQEILNKLRLSPNSIHNIFADRISQASSVNGVVKYSKKNELLNYFRKQLLEFYQIKVDADNKVVTIDVNRNTALEKEAYTFKNNFKAKFSTDVKTLEKELAPLIGMRNEELLPKLGFNVDGVRFVQWLTESGKFPEMDKIKSSITSAFKHTGDLTKIADKPETFSKFKAILDLITQFKNTSMPVQVLVDNKPQYSIVERNFLYKKFIEVKKKTKDIFKSRNTGNLELDDENREFNDEVRRLQNATLKYGSSIKMEDEVQKSSKMTLKPTLIYHINSALNSNISPFINTGDKSSYFGFKDLASIKGFDIETEQYVNAFKSLFRHEYNTFIKYKSADEGVVLPKIDKFFATTRQFVTDIDSLVLTEDGKLIDTTFNDLFKQVSNRIVSYNSIKNSGKIVDFNNIYYRTDKGNVKLNTIIAEKGNINIKALENIAKNLELDVADLYIDISYQAEVSNYRNKINEELKQELIENELYNPVTNEFKYIDKESMNTKKVFTVDSLVDNLNLFFLESNIIQAKYLIGDLGFYGLNLAKRVPAAMAVKKSGSYDLEQGELFSDGGELKLSKNNLNFNQVDADGNLLFDALVMDDFYHYDEVLGAFNKAYKSTKLSDGMAFEHIDAVRFRKVQEGTWTEEDEDLYKADLAGEVDVDTFVKWTMEKTQYFGDQVVEFGEDFAETMNVPTLDKFAVLTLSNSFVNKTNSPILKGIKEIMENNNIPLVMFDSANKITRKKGYKLINENNNKATEVKKGVEELFDSNPELANQVYEALGFNKEPKFFEGNTLNIDDKTYTISEKISSKNLAKRYGFKISSNIPVYIVKENLGVRKGGYDTNQNIIILSENSDKETIEHELIHSVEYNLDKKELNSLYEKVKNKITEDSFKDYVSWNFKKSISEFVADGISKKVFRDALEKEGLLDEVDSALAIYKTDVTPQQKQQALQLYSQYLDTIFPDSKVKDIVYHGTPNDFELFYEGENEVIHFSKHKKDAEHFSEGHRIITAILNLENPVVAKTDYDNISQENFDKFNKQGSFIGAGFEYVVKENKQVHKLGTKQDIEGFKEFVSTPNIQINNNSTEINKYKQKSYWKYYNTQQETPTKDKTEQTQGTQFSMQIFSNILEGDGLLTNNKGETIKADDVINEIDALYVERVKASKEVLYSKLGVTDSLKTASPQALLKEILNNLDQKESSITAREEVTELLKNSKGLDTVLSSLSYEAVLSSLVNKTIIKPKKFGSPMAQVANIGFTQLEFNQNESTISKQEGIIKLDNGDMLPPLPFYQEGDDYLGVYLPNYLKFQGDFKNIDKRLLDLIGFRIPTQGANSIERIRVMGFLPESYGNMIIVPAQITTKAGSDFDIDKLNIYFPNYYTTSKGIVKYEEFLTDENSTLQERYSKYVKRNVKGVKSLIKDLKQSSEYLKYLEEVEKAYERILKNSKITFKQLVDSLEDAEFTNSMVFYSLPNNIQQEYKDYNKQLNNRGIQSLDKQQAFSDFTEIYILNNNPTGELLDNLNLLKATYDIQTVLLGGQLAEAKNNYTDNLGTFQIIKAPLTDKINEDIINAIADFYKLETKEKFGNRTIEGQNTLQAIDNAIHEKYLTILDSKEYKEQMLTPNTDTNIKRLSLDMKNSNTNDGLANERDFLTMQYHITSRQGAQLGKQVLGQAALHSKHHVQTQIADLYLNEAPPAFEDMEKVQQDKTITTFKTFRDAKGHRISDTISEMVNALVDVLKEPYIKYSNITVHNAGTFFYMLRSGVPLEQVVHFFNHPLIKQYNKMVEDRQFESSSSTNSRIHKQVIEKLIGTIDSNSHLKRTLDADSLKKRAKDRDNTLDMPSFDYSVIKEFDRLFNASSKLNEFMRVSKFDTAGVGTSFGETEAQIFDLNKFIRTNEDYIQNWENVFERNGKKTMIGAYKDVVNESTAYFTNLYTADAYDGFIAAREQVLEGVLTKKAAVIRNKFNSDFATYIVQNFSSFPKSLNVPSKDTQTVAQRIKSILNNKNHVLKNNLFLNELMLNTTDATHKVLLQNGSSIDSITSDSLSKSFSELMHQNSQLGYDIIKIGILQDGFNKSPYSYLQTIPIQYKTPITEMFYNVFKPETLKDYVLKFKINYYRDVLKREFSTKDIIKDNHYRVHKKDATGFPISISLEGKIYKVNGDKTIGTDIENSVDIGRSSLDYRKSILGTLNTDFKINITQTYLDNANRIKLNQCN